MYKFFQSCFPISDGVKNVYSTPTCNTVGHPVLMKSVFVCLLVCCLFVCFEQYRILDFQIEIPFLSNISPSVKDPWSKPKAVCESNQEDKSSPVERTRITLSLWYLPMGSVLSFVCSLCSIDRSHMGKQQKLSQDWTRLSTL